MKIKKAFIDRIKAYKQVLVEVERSPLQEVIDDIKHEPYPEKEIEIWENIARVYQSYISKNAIADLRVKEEVFEVLVGASNGLTEMTDFKNIRLLTKEKIEKIIYDYHPVFLDDVI